MNRIIMKLTSYRYETMEEVFIKNIRSINPYVLFFFNALLYILKSF